MSWSDAWLDESTEAVTLSFPSVNWNRLVQALGSTVVLEWQTHVHGALHVTKPEGGRFTVHCTGVSVVAVDDQVLAADQYGRGQITATVFLARGKHVGKRSCFVC